MRSEGGHPSPNTTGSGDQLPPTGVSCISPTFISAVLQRSTHCWVWFSYSASPLRGTWLIVLHPHSPQSALGQQLHHTRRSGQWPSPPFSVLARACLQALIQLGNLAAHYYTLTNTLRQLILDHGPARSARGRRDCCNREIVREA